MSRPICGIRHPDDCAYDPDPDDHAGVMTGERASSRAPLLAAKSERFAARNGDR